jgi:hypothetical protein
MEGKIMQKVIVALTLALILADTAYGASSAAVCRPEPTKIQASEEQASPQINNVAIVQVDELPPPLQRQVELQFAQTPPDQLQKLRDAIAGMPQLSTALKERGVEPSQIIAVNLDSDGLLTLIIITET